MRARGRAGARAAPGGAPRRCTAGPARRPVRVAGAARERAAGRDEGARPRDPRCARRGGFRRRRRAGHGGGAHSSRAWRRRRRARRRAGTRRASGREPVRGSEGGRTCVRQARWAPGRNGDPATPLAGRAVRPCPPADRRAAARSDSSPWNVVSRLVAAARARRAARALPPARRARAPAPDRRRSPGRHPAGRARTHLDVRAERGPDLDLRAHALDAPRSVNSVVVAWPPRSGVRTPAALASSTDS